MTPFFTTRRSSDLHFGNRFPKLGAVHFREKLPIRKVSSDHRYIQVGNFDVDVVIDGVIAPFCARVDQQLLNRSEEHTSALQSLLRISYAVFSLNTKTSNTSIYTYYIIQDTH